MKIFVNDLHWNLGIIDNGIFRYDWFVFFFHEIAKYNHTENLIAQLGILLNSQ